MGMYDSLLNQAYTTKLGRAGDAAGMNQWSNMIDTWARSGMSGDQINSTVMNAFGSSPEGTAYAQRQAQPAAPVAGGDQRMSGGYADPTQGKTGYGSSTTPGDPNRLTGGYADANTAPTADKLAQGGTAPAAGNTAGGWTMVNGLNVPTFGSGDFEFTKNDKYDPNSQGWEWAQGSGDQGGMYQRDTGTSTQGTWGLSEAARNRLVAGGWDPKNTNNVGWNMGSQGGEWGAGQGGMNLAGFTDPNVNPYDKIAQAGYKNSNSTGLNFTYVKDANGNMVPQATTGMNWGTNSGEINRHALAAFGGVVGAGLAIPAIAGAGAGAAAGAGAELGSGSVAAGTAAETGLVDAGTLAATAEGGTAAGTSAGALEGLGGVEPISTSGFTTAQGGVGSLGTAAETGGIGSGAATSTATSASTLSQIQQYVKQGMSVMEAIQKATGGGAAAGTGTSPAGGSGSNGLLGLLGGYYSAQQQKDLAGLLKAPMSRYEGLQDPYNMRLRASYDNPNTFYDSNQWKGLESVYQNSIDRNAATKGNLANPTDRERLLQAYGMKELENYRNGLRGDVNAYDPSKFQDMYKEGAKTEVGANTGMWAQAGRTNPTQVINDITSGVKSAKDIWDLVSGWFS